MAVKKGREHSIAEEPKFELEAPDGGWGYIIALATTVVFASTIIPMAAFGLVFGKFLQSIGDETTGTTLSNGMFNTVNSFTGLIANGLLARYSYRKVSLAGSILFFAGAFGVIFAQNLIELIICFGVIQGLGFGLLMPSTLSAFNSYFNKKMAPVMSLAQAAMVAATIAMPNLATLCMDSFGFRGTLIALAIYSLLCFPATAVLQPVKWHMKKVPIQNFAINSTVIPIDENHQQKPKHKSLHEDILRAQIEPLMHQRRSLMISQKSLKSLGENVYPPRLRKSLISLGDRVASVSTIHDLRDEIEEEEEELSFWQSLLKSMDMSLLKDLKYLNISIGLALCFTADIAFISIIPLMLGNIGYQPQEIAQMMAVFFGSDLLSRVLLTVVSGLVKIKSRYLMLFSAFFTAVFRVVLVTNDDYLCKISVLAVLGFLRCFIQTPLPLVISEEYPDKFATAFSLYMAVNGVVSLIFGPLMSAVKFYTQSDVMVAHVLTTAFGICVVTWIAEMIFCRKKQNSQEM